MSSCVGAIGLTQVPIVLSSEPSIPKLTLNVPRTVNLVDARTWCQAADARGTGKPFGFNRVRFYRDKTNIEDKDYLIGCLTNNSGRMSEYLLLDYQVQYPPDRFSISVGTSYLDISTLKPGQTAFFRTRFEIDSEAIGINIGLGLYKQQGQTLTTEPVQRLIIQRSK